MKKIFFFAIVFLLSITASAQKIPADKIIGTWESINSDVKLTFDIYKQGNQYFGKLVYASTMYEKDGKTIKKDFKNPNKNLRERSRKNMINITNLTFKDNEYSGGKLYNPDDGDSYSLKGKLKSENQLEFRGYMGVSLLGKTMKFQRVASHK